MADPRQQVSTRGIRVLGAFVLAYLAVGSYMYFALDLPTAAYVAYGLLSWIGGMALFYRLHKSFMADFEQEVS
jgi:hypothetical protein